MIVLFTDYGIASPYVGQVKHALIPYAPTTPIIDLCHEVSVFDSQAAAYLLAAYSAELADDSVVVGVVDPGVGGDRRGLIVRADQQLYVGPDNGLFDRVAARAATTDAWQIVWRSSRVSKTFHGRDIFGPVAAMLAAGTATPEELGEPITLPTKEWPDDLARVVYADRYGNLTTGIRAASMGDAQLAVEGIPLERAETFSDVAPGDGFWYENSNGLAEIAVNQGNAAVQFVLQAGDNVEVSGVPLTEIRVR